MASAYLAHLAMLAQRNTDFRRVAYTSDRAQIVLMSLQPQEEIGEEVHAKIEQSFFFISGMGVAEIKNRLYQIRPGDTMVIPPGTRHNVANNGSMPLKFVTIYTPPAHIDGRVHPTKADAEADKQDAKYGASRNPRRRR